jgi:peptide subunit release factor 1 (eRF1)
MNKNKTDYLFNKYPQLYSGKDEPLSQNLMAFGFECGDGWFELLDELSAQIMAVSPDTVAVQVKEKFGGLRFYFNCPSSNYDEIQKIVDEAEEKSYTICEKCGSTENVTQSKSGWIVSLCDMCMKDEFKT